MTRTISATDARVHFGEVLRGVKEDRATYYVERSGTPVAVVIPVEEYEALLGKTEGEYKRPAWLENAIRVGHEWSAARNGQPLDIDKLIDEGRDERDDELPGSLLRRERSSETA